MFIYDLKLQDKYNTCALSKHIGKYVYSARNAGKGSALCLAFFPIPKPHTHITYMLRQCTSIVQCICISIYATFPEEVCTMLFFPCLV